MRSLRYAAIVLVSAACVTTGCGRRTNGDAALLGVREFHTWPVPPDGVTQPAPRSIAVGGNREVCVLDSAGRVLVYAANGQLLRQWRMPETAAGRPEGVVILKDGHVVVCDTHYHRVIEFDPQGGEVRRFGREGQGAGEFIYPVAVAVDDRERLYIAEYGSNDRVQVFTRTGVWVRVFGGFGTQPGQFQRPSGMVWHAGRVYVADAFNNRIQVFGEDGAFEGVLATPALRFPYDLKLGADRSLYVVEYGAGRVTRLALDGRLLGRYGQSGAGLGEFGTPWGLALPDAGRVLVADTGNRRLVELVLK